MKNSNVSILYDKFLSADCSYYGVLIAYGGLQDVRDVSYYLICTLNILKFHLPLVRGLC